MFACVVEILTKCNSLLAYLKYVFPKSSVRYTGLKENALNWNVYFAFIKSQTEEDRAQPALREIYISPDTTNPSESSG